MGAILKVTRLAAACALPLVVMGTLAAPQAASASAPGALPSPPAPARAVPGSQPARTSQATSARLADEAVASGLARQTGRRVEVTSQTTETARLFAEPTGNLTLELHSQPVRVHRGPGWVPIDTSLKAASDNTVRPGATLADLAFSSGGSGPFARLSHNGLEMSLGWPKPLSAPVISGDKAMYPEVLPGVYLLVQATADGFSELLVVKSHQAALNPALGRVRFAVSTRGLSLSPAAGGLVARDSSGATVFSAAAPSMYDSSGTDNGDPRSASVGLSLGKGELTVVPDATMLADPTLRFPLVIDPFVSLGMRQWGNIEQLVAPNQGIAQDPYRSQGAKSGYAYDSTQAIYIRYRSMFAFWMNGVINGTHILSASFGATISHSWSCDSTPIELWSTGAINDGTSWNNSSWGSLLDTQNASACNGLTFVNFSGGLTGFAQAAANAGNWPDITVGLKAQDENNVDQWKRICAGGSTYDGCQGGSSDPTLSIQYNHFPNTPTGLDTDQGKGCVIGSGRPFVTTTLSPQLKATVSDPDGDVLNASFELWHTGGSQIDTIGQNGVANGAAAIVSVPTSDLQDGNTYSWRVRTNDGIDWSPFAGWCEFTVDVTPPGTPGNVTSTDYPGCVSPPPTGCLSTAGFHGKVGQSGVFTIAPPAAQQTEIAGYLVGLNAANQPSSPGVVFVSAAADHSGSVSLAPTSYGPNAVHVWTREVSGNISQQPLEYDFLAKRGDGTFGPGAPSIAFPSNTTVTFGSIDPATGTSPDQNVAAYRYSIDDTSLSNTVATTAGAPQTVTATPGFFVDAVAVDQFGNVSPATSANFPDPPPTAPRSVTAVAGNGQATVSWLAPASNGGSAIASYTVTATPGGQTVTVNGSTLTATVTGLTNGTAYTFTVRATNALFTGPAGGPSNSVVPATVPGAPTGVSATAGNAQATVSWAAPASNGGSAITGYTVTASPGGAIVSVSGSTTTATVTGLTNGTAYTFTVTATNSVGTGTASAASSAVTPATVPGAPTGVTATAGNAQATVSWVAPASNGGSAITGFTVTASPGGAMVSVSGSTTTATVTGLTNGTAYTFTVTATNAVGTGPASAASNSVTPAVLGATFVQQVSGTGANSATVTLGANVTAGNRLIVVAMAWGSMTGNSTANVIDSAGNAYVEVQTIKDVDGNEESIWTAPITSGGGTQLTVTVATIGCGGRSCSSGVAIAVLEYAGLASVADASVVDQQVSSASTTTAAATVTSGATVAPAAPNELALGVYADANSGATVTPGSGWASRANDTPVSGLALVVADQTVAQGATPNASFAVSQSAIWLASTVVFKLR